MLHGETAIDMSGFAATFAIFGVLALIVLVLRTIHKMAPQLAERFKDMTPWLGWMEDEDDTEYVPRYITHAFHRPERTLNRW